MKNLALLSPADMCAGARANEIASILAAAIVRSQSAEGERQRQVGLGFLPDQRVHTTPYREEKL